MTAGMAFAVLLGVLVVLSIWRWRELPLLVVVAIEPFKQFLVQNEPFFRAVDPMLLVTLWALAIAIGGFPKRSGRLRWFPWTMIWCHALLVVWSAASLTWTSAPVYGANKVLRFGLLSVVWLYAPVLIVRSPAEMRRLQAGIATIAVLVYAKIAVAPSYAVPEGAGEKFFRPGFLYQNDAAPVLLYLGGALCMSAAASRLPRPWRLVAIGGAFVLMAGAWTTGTRALIVSLAVSGIAAVVLYGGMGAILRKAWLVGLAAIAMILASNLAPELQRQRIAGGFGGEDASTKARLEHYKLAMATSQEHPLGAGAGSYAVIATGMDERFFPHNILLEAAAELGLPGAAMLAGVLLAFVSRARRFVVRHGATRRPVNEMAVAWVVAFIAVLAVSQVTDDLADNRGIWLSMGLSAAAFTTHGPTVRLRASADTRTRDLTARGTSEGTVTERFDHSLTARGRPLVSAQDLALVLRGRLRNRAHPGDPQAEPKGDGLRRHDRERPTDPDLDGHASDDHLGVPILRVPAVLSL